jgi:hypothetical protein
LEVIDKLRKEIFDDEYKTVEGANLTEEEIAKDKERRDNELLDDIVTVTIDETLDFKKVENMSLSSNYALLYESVFINYK